MKKYVVAGAVIFATFGYASAQDRGIAMVNQAIGQINTARANVCVGNIQRACLEESGEILKQIQALKARMERFLEGPRDPDERKAISVELNRLADELDKLDVKFLKRDFRVSAN